MDECIRQYTGLEDPCGHGADRQILTSSCDSCMRCIVINHSDTSFVYGSDIENFAIQARDLICECPGGKGGRAWYEKDIYDLEFDFDPEDC